MSRRVILLAVFAVESERAKPYLPVGGGVPCRHDRVHDCGRALPEHPSGVALPLRRASGRCRAGPATVGGGRTTLRPPGSRFAVPLFAPSRLPCGCRHVSSQLPFFILCACYPCSLWPELRAWSLPPCSTILVLIACMAVGWHLLHWEGGGGGSLLC